MSVKIQDIDRGHGRLKKSFRKAQWDVRVGVPDTPHAPDGKPTDEIAAAHEFGLGVPQRSFLRDWVDEQHEAILDAATHEAALVAVGGEQWHTAAKRLGQWAVDGIRKRIWARIAPPLAEETAERKGTSVPLVDTGQLVNSIIDEVEGR